MSCNKADHQVKSSAEDNEIPTRSFSLACSKDFVDFHIIAKNSPTKCNALATDTIIINIYCVNAMKSIK